jgi:hypothetical protein
MNKNKLRLRPSHYLLALIVAASMSLTVNAQQGLIVKSNTGSTTSISYSDAAKLTFVNEIMTVVSPAGVVGQSFALATTKLISFGNVTPNALNDISGSSTIKLYPTLANSSICLQGATEGTFATIYSITGSKVMQIDVKSNLESINVSDLKTGIYMLRTNGKTFKFNKQ